MKVDMAAIVDAMSNGGDPDVDWFVDLETGEVQIAIGGAERASLAPGVARRRYAPVPAIDAKQDHAIMARFAEQVADRSIRDRLSEALDGKSAFAGFRAVVSQYPDLQRAWIEAKRRAYTDLVTEWLAEHGVDARYDRESGAERASIEPGAESRPPVGLVALLLLGAPGGKTELIEGRVERRFVAGSPAEARAVFEAVARDLCTCYGIPWRGQLVDGRDRFELEGVDLRLQGPRVHLSVRVSPALWRAFRAGS